MAGKLNGALLLDPDNLAKPDFSQMVPFKPKVSSIRCFGFWLSRNIEKNKKAFF